MALGAHARQPACATSGARAFSQASPSAPASLAEQAHVGALVGPDSGASRDESGAIIQNSLSTVHSLSLHLLVAAPIVLIPQEQILDYKVPAPERAVSFCFLNYFSPMLLSPRSEITAFASQRHTRSTRPSHNVGATRYGIESAGP